MNAQFKIKERAWSFGRVSPVGFVSENGPAGSSSERTKAGCKIRLDCMQEYVKVIES